jgi:hypothetical protein
MTDEQWAHAAGTHTEHGPFTAELWLQLTAVHAHAAQILVAQGVGKKLKKKPRSRRFLLGSMQA